MPRVKFSKGEQRNFLKTVLKAINCPSLRELNNRGFEISYSTLKNYYSEKRLLPLNFFNDLCFLGKINPKDFDIIVVEDNFGQVLGGKKSKRKGSKK